MKKSILIHATMNTAIWLFIAFAAVMLVSYSKIAFAQDVPPNEVTGLVTWEAPTTREDGSPLSADEIAGYRIYFGVDEDISLDSSAFVDVDASEQGLDLKFEFDSRNEPYVLNVAGVTIDTNGTESDLSEVKQKSFLIPVAAPKPPIIITISIDCPACGDAVIGVAQ